MKIEQIEPNYTSHLLTASGCGGRDRSGTGHHEREACETPTERRVHLEVVFHEANVNNSSVATLPSLVASLCSQVAIS